MLFENPFDVFLVKQLFFRNIRDMRLDRFAMKSKSAGIVDIVVSPKRRGQPLARDLTVENQLKDQKRQGGCDNPRGGFDPIWP